MRKHYAKIKRPLWVVGLNIALALTVGSTQAFADTPITNQTQLEAIGTDLAGSYVVTESFGVVAPVSGGSTYVAGNFTGTFDGGGFTISGLTKPLFEFIDSVSNPRVTHISDLTLEAATGGVTGAGILAIEVYSGTVIDNVDVTGDVNGNNYVGGLVGDNAGTISNSSAAVTVIGNDYVGGLAGYSNGEISNSYATGTVDGNDYVGGFVGSTGISSNNSLVTNSYATGDVTGSGGYIGGLVGNSYGTITNSYATGSVDGIDEVGGLVGYLGGILENTYAAGNVSGIDSVGGLVGETGGISGHIHNSYATGTVIGIDAVGGLVGSSDIDIANSYSTGVVTGEIGVGGLVGVSYGDIANSSATGDVTGEIIVGGLVGVSYGDIEFSYATGNVTSTVDNDGYGDEGTGGLVGGMVYGSIGNSYSTGDVNGYDNIGGLVGGISGLFSTLYLYNSYASGDVNGDLNVGGLVGGMQYGDIEFSLASGNVNGDSNVGGLVGLALEDSYISDSGSIGSITVSGENVVNQLIGSNQDNVDNVTFSYDLSGGELPLADYLDLALSLLNTEYIDYTGYPDSLPTITYAYPLNFAITPNLNSGLPYLISNPPLADELELALSVLNTGSAPDSPIFALVSNLNSGLPYLISNPPLADEDEVLADAPRYDFSFLSTQVLDVLKKSIGFKAAKSDLSKLDLALLDQVKSDKSAQIIGGKLFSYQSPLTSLSVGSLLQLEINFEANKSLQMWVKSLDDQYALVGDITFDKDGNAVLPGIEFKKSGQYELIFVNSDKKDLTQPELMNKVIGLTVYVN
jgi:hypothetical protein